MKKQFLALVAMAATGLAAELPVRTVILYKHGVGYFERSGDLAAGESARLDFKATDMNDVLKSLTIEDKAGKITGLRYDASEPLEKRLEDYPFALGEGQSLSQFLDQLKGASIEIQLGPSVVHKGAIVGARRVAMGDKSEEREELTLLLDSGEIRKFDFSGITAWKLTDPVLAQKLKDYLATLAVARSRELRSVYIDSSDARARQVIASYMIPMPVWKSSYRLVLRDAAEAMLEGWAIVDNTTGVDWTNVNLSLVSGRPISFISKLYEPRYRDRPEVELPEDRAVRPVVDTGTVALAKDETGGGVGGGVYRRPAAPPPPAPMAAPMRMAERADMASSVTPDTTGRELGDLFEYRFSSPVTVKKNESAMLPFLQQKAAVRKLLIYSDRSLQNPMNAAELTNSTGKTLDGGPITVYEGGAYAGEALVETLKAGDKRLLTYGVDLGTRITTALDSTSQDTREITASRGVLRVKLARLETQTYTINNVDAKEKTLLIEQPIRSGYTVLSPKPSETTATARRFEVKLRPKTTEKLTVNEEFVYDQTVLITQLNSSQLGVYISNKALSADGRRQLEALAAAQQRIADTDRDIRNLDKEVAELVQDQSRIRENLGSLNRVSGQQEQVQKYARELADQESRLAGMRDKLSQLRRQKTQQEQELASLIEKVSF